jgi:putative transposase
MRKGRFSEEQMVAIIREADRDPVAAVAKRHGISEQTIYTWRKRFGGLQALHMPRVGERDPSSQKTASRPTIRSRRKLRQRRLTKTRSIVSPNKRVPTLGPVCDSRRQLQVVNTV